jgi:hypothetical protein
LIIATERYEAPSFTQLAAPAHDAQALRNVLSDPTVGAFEVTVLRNPTTQEARLALESFFVEVKRDDLLLIHFSCHGVKNPEGELYLAMRDTLPNRLAATGLPADFVNRLMATSRAQQIALFLDCCFGGAFDRGMRPRATGSVNVKDAFQKQESVRAGRARVVVAAAGDVQYALEGGAVVDRHDQPSVFTGVVVEALSTGKADRDGDGWVGIYELFDYVCDHVAELTTVQVPELSTFGAHGDILLAHSQARLADPAPLEEELADLLASRLTTARLNGIAELRSRVVDLDLDQAASAWRELERRSSNDASAAVRSAAVEALAAATLRVTEGPVELDEDGTAVVEVGGPPLARQVRADSDVAWLAVVLEAGRVLLSVQKGWAPAGKATVTITGPTGSASVEVPAPPPLAAPPQPPPPPRPDPVPRRRWVARVVAGCLLALAIVAGLVVWQLVGGGDDEGPAVPSPLPQGDALADDVALWMVKEGEEKIERIQFGGPESPSEPLDALGGWVTWPTLTKDRRTILYLSANFALGPDTLWAAGSHGEDQRRIIDDPTCPSAGRPSVNPAGTEVAVVCKRSSTDAGGPDIRIYSTDGTLQRTFDWDKTVGNPTWTADGRSLVYWQQTTTKIGDGRGSNLYVVAADDQDAEPRKLTSGPFRDELPVVTPDLSAMVFVRLSKSETRELYLMELNGDGANLAPLGQSTRMAASDEGVPDTQPTLSPDEPKLWFLKDDQVYETHVDVDSAAVPVNDVPTGVDHISWSRR